MNRKITVAIASAIVSIASLATAAVAASPSAAPESGWVRTNDEAGWALVSPTFGVPFTSTAPADARPLKYGDISADGQYVYAGEGSGWLTRTAEYRYQSGRFVRVDDSVGHLPRLADAPATANERRAAAGQVDGS